MIRIAFTLVSLLLLTSCAHKLTEKECRAQNWRYIGEDDGREGRLPTHFNDHKENCAQYKVVPNLDEYSEGYALGIKLFCKPSNIFNYARKGKQNLGQCKHAKGMTSLAEEAFLIGREASLIEDEIDLLEEELATLEEQRRDADIMSDAYDQLRDLIEAKEEQIGLKEKRIELLKNKAKRLDKKV